MRQLYIPFTEEPLDLEATLEELSFKPTVKKLSFEPEKLPSTWIREFDGKIKLRIDLYPHTPGCSYTIRVSTKNKGPNNGPIAERRLAELVTRIKEHYSTTIEECYDRPRIE